MATAPIFGPKAGSLTGKVKKAWLKVCLAVVVVTVSLPFVASIVNLFGIAYGHELVIPGAVRWTWLVLACLVTFLYALRIGAGANQASCAVSAAGSHAFRAVRWRHLRLSAHVPVGPTGT